MKRLLLALFILTLGTTLFSAFHGATAQLRRQTAEVREAFSAQTQLIAGARMQLTTTEQRVHSLDLDLRSRRHAAQPANPLWSLVGTNRLTPAQREQLLAELGFNWNNPGDYLIVSKQTLRSVSVEGVHAGRLSTAACTVLAVTPEERARIDTALRGINDDYQAWARAHMQREEPAGDVLARYSLPEDAESSLSLSNRFATAIGSTLGDERAKLLLSYAGTWMSELGMQGTGTTMTLTRNQEGDTSHIGLTVKTSNSTMTTTVTPHQPVPEAFLTLFPNGWTDIAQREGFPLPKDFDK